MTIILLLLIFHLNQNDYCLDEGDQYDCEEIVFEIDDEELIAAIEEASHCE